MERTHSQNRAFTLIELLVVIAIISILATILLPSLATAQKLAKGVSCTNNLRNMGMSAALLQQDNNGMLPYSRAGNGNTWKYQLMIASGAEPDGYGGVLSTEGFEYFFCPSWDEDGFTPPAGLEPWYTQWNSYKVAITQSTMSAKWGAVKYYTSLGGSLSGFSISDIALNPGDVVFTCDAIAFNDSLFWNRTHIYHETIGVSNKHVGNANILWLDGHASAEYAITDNLFDIDGI